MAKQQQTTPRASALRNTEQSSSVFDALLENPWTSLIFTLAPLSLITILDGGVGNALLVMFMVLAGMFTIGSKKDHPWVWIFLAINPLFIINGIHTVDFYIKAIWVAVVLAVAFVFHLGWRKGESRPQQVGFTFTELMWLIYFIWGCVALLWSVQPVLGFERLVYFGFPMGGYVLAKRTRFWESSLFWHVYAAVALVVSFIGCMMYYYGGTGGFLSFDWIMSAGRPSSTLSYRAYTSTYLVVSLPFLLWYIFSRHVKNTSDLIFAILSFGLTVAFLFYTRARSGWMGFFASVFAMALLFAFSKKWSIEPVRKRMVIFGAALVPILLLAQVSPSKMMLEGDKSNPQKLQGTGKEEVTSALSTVTNVLESGQSDRFDFWDMSRHMLVDSSSRKRMEGPLNMPFWPFGVGIGQFPVYVPVYSNILHLLGAEVHNDWIQVLVESGPIGFVCFTLFMLSMLYYAVSNRQNGLMIASAGAIVAWFFSTQTDFLTPRLYGALWVGAIAAMIYHEAKVPKVFTLKSFAMPRWAGIAGGLFFVWLGASYYITASLDRMIYTALTQRNPPVDVLVQNLFGDKFPSLKHGVGKYLIFQPISDLSRAVSVELQKQPNNTVMQNVQADIARGILQMHPLNYNAYAVLTDVAFRQKKFPESIEYIDKYLEIRPFDANMWLAKSQALLATGKKKESAEAAFTALSYDPESPMVQQFWMTQVPEAERNEIMKMKK